MRSGVVEVLCVANLHRNNDASYLTTVVYRTPEGDTECLSIARWRTAATPISVCAAMRRGDQMHCLLCRKAWDITDPEPPECPASGG